MRNSPALGAKTNPQMGQGSGLGRSTHGGRVSGSTPGVNPPTNNSTGSMSSVSLPNVNPWKVPEVAEFLTQRGLVDQASISEACRSTDARGQTLPVFAERLVSLGKLTEYQAELVSSGRPELIWFDDYVIVNRLGAGGMGEVFKARNTLLDRMEAIKTIIQNEGASVQLSERFKREAKALARLEHPNIVPIYKISTYQGVSFIAMRFINGVDLKTRADQAKMKGSALPVTQVCRWISDAADALAHAHKQGIIHRDIKPSNLMIATSDERLYVLDMGIARLSEGSGPTSELTQQGRGLGTPEFMPGEQWANAREVFPQSDVYALGGTLFYALTGSVPYPARSSVELMKAHIGSPVPSARALRPEVPSGLDSVVRKMLAKRIEDRYETAEEVVAALRPFCGVETAAPIETQISPFDSQHKDFKPKLPLNSADASPVKPVVAKRPSFAMDKEDKKGDFNPWPFVAATLLILVGLAGYAVYRGDLLKGGAETQPTNAKVDPEKPSEKETKPAQKSTEPVAKVEPKPEEKPAKSQTPAVVKNESPEDFNKRWLAEYQSVNNDIWPNLAELEKVSRGLTDFSKLRTPRDLEGIKFQLDELSGALRKPFAKIDNRIFPNDGTTEIQTNFLKDLLAIHAVPMEGAWQLTLQTVDLDAKPITTAMAKQDFRLRFVNNSNAYLTPVLVDKWSMAGIAIPDLFSAVALGDAHELSNPLTIDQPGPTTIYVYMTDAPILTSHVLYVEPPGIPVGATDDNRKGLRNVFGHPMIFDRLQSAFSEGKPYPHIGPSTKIQKWTRAKVTINILEEKKP